ncbi:MAG: ABC transporter permease [Thermoleophilia bacterium]|nr:ABC transporter permease [Thermoleophilia bacterium]
MSLLQETWQAYTDPLNDGWGRTVEHIRLSLTALALATVAGVVLGITAAKVGRGAAVVVVTIGNLGRMVPTLAIIGIIVVFFPLGFWPAAIGLFLLGIPPILVNAYTGIRDVDPGAREASRGMGLSRRQVLTRVELPLALPLIVAGVRTSAVEIVATATLAGLVGAGGLGVLVLAGLGNNQTEVILAGAIPVAILAVLAELVFAGAERLATPRGLRITRGLATQRGTA